MAAEELDRVRSSFVENVNNDIIKQLLDDLFGDGILNRGEKDSIIDENPGRADRARNLIDTVSRKGDLASRTMINHLQKRDPTLSARLGLQGELDALDEMDLR